MEHKVEYTWGIDSMTPEEIAEEEEFLYQHNWVGNEGNCGLSFKVFIESMNAFFAPVLNSKSSVILIGGAKGFGKTFITTGEALFGVCNFSDYNAEFWKDAKAHAYNHITDKIYKVIANFDKHGSEITDHIEAKNIILKDNKASDVFEMTWPNKRRFEIFGFENIASWAGRDDKPVGAVGTLIYDEIIPVNYSDKPIVDGHSYNKTHIQWFQQKIRSNDLKEFDRKLKMWTVDIKYSFENDLGEELFHEVTISYHKNFKFYATFNNNDTSGFRHPIKEFYLRNKKSDLNIIRKEGYQVIQDDTFYTSLGMTCFFGSTKMNEENLSPKISLMKEDLRTREPELHDQIFIGAEAQFNLERYSFKKNINHRFEQQNLFVDTRRFIYDQLLFGMDYADSVKGKDDTSLTFGGVIFERDMMGNIINKIKSLHVISARNISSKEYADNNIKLDYMVDWTFEEWYKKFRLNTEHYGKKGFIFTSGQDSRTVGQVIENKCATKINNPFLASYFDFHYFKSTGINAWSISSREQWMNFAIAQGKISFDLKFMEEENQENKLLIDLMQISKDPLTDLRNEKPGQNHLDFLNALEHCFFPFHAYLF